MLKRYIPTKWVGGKTIGTADVMNNIEQGINDVNDDICESSTSGDLLNENVNSFKVGTGTIDGESIDFTNQMEQSLTTLDNIQGKTVKKDTTLLSNEIFRLYSSDIPKITNIEKAVLGKSLNPSTGEFNVSENYYVSQFINIEPNTLYVFENIDANICFYDVNGNFISNYDNSHNNNMHIFGNYGLHRYSFYVTTPKNASTVRCTVHNNANPSIVRVKKFYEPKITLRSLPNGVCDELKNGELIQRVGRVVLNGSEKWVQAGGSQGKVQFVCENILSNYKHSTGDSHFEIGGIMTQYWIKKSDVEGENYVGECIRVYDSGNSTGHVYIKLNAGDVNALVTTLIEKPVEILYELKKPIVTPLNLSILVNSGDTIHIDTPVSLTCTHKVSLNTKSQIEELQEVTQREKKSVWQKIKELTDVKMSLTPIGYVKLPTILGGLIFQWGYINVKVPYDFAWNNPLSSSDYSNIEGNFPITFPHNVFGIYGGISGLITPEGERTLFYHETFSGKVTTVHGQENSKYWISTRREPTEVNLNNWSIKFDWFAIGR